MGDSPIITLPFLMESSHPNLEVKVREEFIHKGDVSNLNTQQYNCWIDDDKRVDQLSERDESGKSPSRSFREKSWSPMPFEEDFLSQPSPNVGNQAFTTTNNEESDDDLDLPPKAHRNKNRPFPQPTSHRSQSSQNPKQTWSSHPRKLPSVPPVPTSSQPKGKEKNAPKAQST